MTAEFRGSSDIYEAVQAAAAARFAKGAEKKKVQQLPKANRTPAQGSEMTSSNNVESFQQWDTTIAQVAVRKGAERFNPADLSDEVRYYDPKLGGRDPRYGSK